MYLQGTDEGYDMLISKSKHGEQFERRSATYTKGKKVNNQVLNPRQCCNSIRFILSQSESSTKKIIQVIIQKH